jgi:hypothetical protein
MTIGMVLLAILLIVLVIFEVWRSSNISLAPECSALPAQARS